MEGMDDLSKPPTIWNVELNALYMHDGRFNILDEVINQYSENVEKNEWSVGLIPEGGFNFSLKVKEEKYVAIYI